MARRLALSHRARRLGAACMASEAAETERARLAAEELAAAIALRAAEMAFARLSAEEMALAEVLAPEPAKDGGRGVIDSIAVTAGYESALAAALGDDLLAPEDEEAPTRWRTLPLIGDADGNPLPPGAHPLAPMVGAPDALARRLRQIGVVDSAADGDRLQRALHPGQRLASRDGALWRWDGYIRAAGVDTPAGIRLRQRARLDNLIPQRIQAETARSVAATRHQEARRAASEAISAEGRARAEQRAAEHALARARQSLAETETKRSRIISVWPRSPRPKARSRRIITRRRRASRSLRRSSPHCPTVIASSANSRHCGASCRD